jgi:hypothetical protein
VGTRLMSGHLHTVVTLLQVHTESEAGCGPKIGLMSIEQMYVFKDMTSLYVIFARHLACLHTCQVQNTRNRPYS